MGFEVDVGMNLWNLSYKSNRLRPDEGRLVFGEKLLQLRGRVGFPSELRQYGQNSWPFKSSSST